MGGISGNYNGYRNSDHCSKESEEERKLRKEKERKAREKETDEERRLRKEREHGRRKETEEERRKRKEREKASGGARRKESEEERKIRKEKEREKRAHETEDERKLRKERERMARKIETEDERRQRKEKEKHGSGRRRESEEERKIRKDKERASRLQKTDEEKCDRSLSKSHDGSSAGEDSLSRKNEDVQWSNRRERKPEIKEEMQELGDDYFAAEEERLNASRDRVADEENVDDPDEWEGESKSGIIPDNQCDESEDDIPLAKRMKPALKRKVKSEDEADESSSMSKNKIKRQKRDSSEDEKDFKPSKKSKVKSEKRDSIEDEKDFKPTKKSKVKSEKEETDGPTKKMTKKEKELEAEKQVWKWWEEDNALPEGVKWKSLEHKGPLFAPEYEPLPKDVRFWYEGKVIHLTEHTEECATFYGKMLDHDYTTKEVFNRNFFKDWRKIMTEKEKAIIRDLSKCDFSEINEHFKKISEERKNR